MNAISLSQVTSDQLLSRFDNEDQIQKFISGELILVPTEVAPLPQKIFLTMNYDLFNIRTALEIGNFDSINPQIDNVNFEIEGKGVRELEFNLFRTNTTLQIGDVLKEMRKDSDPENPWLPARIEHGLLFTEAFPAAQKKDPIVTPGTFLQIDGEKLIPYFSSTGIDRIVCLGSYVTEWINKIRFLQYRLRKPLLN